MPERKPGFLHTTGASEIINRLPKSETLNPTSVTQPDLFICALGFEPRVTSLPKQFASCWSLSKSTSLVGEYQTNKNDNDTNREPLQQALKRFSRQLLQTDADSPNKVHRSIDSVIASSLPQIEGKVKVVFDISGSSVNFIISVMYALFIYAERITLDIVYAEAGEYYPVKSYWDGNRERCVSEACDYGDQDTFLDCGVETPERNELYAGFFHDARPDYVIAIPGYRTQRLVRCISMVSEQILASPAQSVFWIFGAPPLPDRAWRLDLQRDMLVRMFNDLSGSKIGASTDLFENSNSRNCSTLDYQDTLACILEIADKQIGSRISVIPMGSKMQSIGLSLALAVRREIGITIARPSKFNPKAYSKETGPAYRLSFGDLDKILCNLMRIGTLKYQPTSGSAGMDIPSI